jgi:heat shock protein HslJ
MTIVQKFGVSFAALTFSAAALAAPQPGTLVGGTWLLQPAAGQAVSGAYLRFDGKLAQGNDSCNQFRSGYQAGADSALTFDANSGAATLMACGPEKDASSKAFKDALAQTQSYSVDGQKLELLGAEKKVLAVFHLQNENLSGTQWQLQGLNNGKNAVVSQASVEQLSIHFLPAGKFQASSPCGQLTSYYRSNQAKHSISIRKPRADGKVCAKTNAAYAEFQQLKKALKNSRTYQITGERLELRDKKGALQISANTTR